MCGIAGCIGEGTRRLSFICGMGYHIGVTRYEYTQGAGCESLRKGIADAEMSDEEYERIKAENPHLTIKSKEAAYYFKIFRRYHPQDSILGSIGIWTGFDFAEERAQVRGTVDGDLKYGWR